MPRTVAEKMRLNPTNRSYLLNTPTNFLETIGLTELESESRCSGEFDYIHLFAKTQSELEANFSNLKEHLTERGSLWVSWPKGGQLDTDLNLHEVIRIGYARGMVESTCLSVDPTWSALRFTHPKPGKVYNNSHAKLITD